MRSLRERARDPMWWVEQALHFLLFGSVAYAFAPDLPWWGSFTLSSSLCIARELIQNLRRDGWHGSKGDSAVDAAFGILGAAIGSLIK